VTKFLLHNLIIFLKNVKILIVREINVAVELVIEISKIKVVIDTNMVTVIRVVNVVVTNTKGATQLETASQFPLQCNTY